jgi:hypothetical protein
MDWELYYDPWKNHPFYLTKENFVDWKGTPGVGDILFGLNTVHMLCHLSGRDHLQINVHWDHNSSHLHHYEDPETIVDRCDYLHNFYYNKDAIKINHCFDSYDKELWEIRHRGFQRKAGPTKVLDGICNWIYDPKYWPDTVDDNKVVFWRPLFNAESPPSWKRSFGTKDWEQIIKTLEDKGYNLVELTYRTPVREAFYHIKTCRFAIYYDGMWQYICKNFMKPVIVLGKNKNILDVHNPQGVHFYSSDDKNNSLWKYLDKLPQNLNHLDSRVDRYKKVIMDSLNVQD